jgi:uncharacterized membrane protein
MNNQTTVSVKVDHEEKILILPKWKSVRFWQELFIYFCAFAIVGHYLEIVWFMFRHLTTGSPMRWPITPIMLVAIPYGLGVVAIILLVIPLIKRYKLSLPKVFILNVLVSGVIEYTCAVIIVMTEGYNEHWNYTSRPLNINGFTCLEATIIFGILATFFIYFIYPFCEKLLQKLSNKQVLIIFLILAISYGVANWSAN